MTTSGIIRSSDLIVRMQTETASGRWIWDHLARPCLFRRVNRLVAVVVRWFVIHWMLRIDRSHRNVGQPSPGLGCPHLRLGPTRRTSVASLQAATLTAVATLAGHSRGDQRRHCRETEETNR